MFVSMTTAIRVERAEAEMTRTMADAVIASGRAPDAFVRTLGAGVAAYVRPRSPMNKVIGVGLDAPIERSGLAGLEAALRARDEPVRIELATLAVPESGPSLSARGYHLLGFENVLVRPPSAPVPRASDVRIERVTPATERTWKETLVDAVGCPDGTGAPVDELSRDTIAAVLEDVLEARAFDRYLAFVDGALAGGASMFVHEDVAVLTGSATLAGRRRRGVQSALIATRLDEADARGARLAVITTAPGSQSQANVMKHGFVLAYARAILVSNQSSVNVQSQVSASSTNGSDLG
jgi:GNAT superfamily N-acetyltransferase